MTIDEFILLDKAKVRRDSNLMSLYLDFFKTAFGRVPNCAGCSFGTDWQKLVSLYSNKGEKKVTLQKGKIMNTISIKKIQGKILTYKKDGRTYRQYDNILTDAFIKEFISNGTDQEIEQRKKMFNFPDLLDEEKVISEIQKSISNTVNEVIKETDKVFSEAINTHSQPKKRGPKKRK